MLKKRISAIIGLAVAFSVSVTGFYPEQANAAEQTADARLESHSHTYVDTVIAPTCEDQGYTLHVCDCGDSYKDSYTDELNHDYYAVDTGTGTHRMVCRNDASHSYEEGHEWSYQNRVLPTCTDEGYTTYVCGKCGAEENREYVPSLGHDYSWIDNANGSHTGICSRNKNHVVTEFCHEYYKDYVTPPTCDDQGYTSHICSKCGYVLVDTYVQPNGHDYVYTDNGDGSHTGVCTHDSSHVVRKNHNMTEEMVAPTCTERGYNKHTCKDCGYTFNDDYIPWLGHKWSYTSNENGTHRAVCENDAAHVKSENCDYEEKTVAPTDKEQGYTLHTCKLCGYSYKDQFVPSTEHKYIWHWNDDGTHTGRCENCDDEITEKCSYTSEVTEPTCTQNGYTEHTCKVCGRTYKDNYREKIGHDYTWTSLRDGRHSGVCNNNASHRIVEECHYENIVIKPTCDKGGYTLHRCTVCGYEYKDSFTNRLDHNYVYKDLGNGTHSVICTNHDEEITITQPHTYTTKVVNATCTSQGYTVHTCQLCGSSYTDSVVPAKGHRYVWSAIDNTNHKAVCLNDPTHTLTAAHNGTATVTKPTCTTDGFTTHVCKTCGHVWKDSITKATGHNYTWIVDRPAEVGISGSKHEQCTHCGAKKPSVKIPSIKAATLLPIIESKSTKQTIRWKAIPGADRYVIYGNNCGKKMYKLKTVKGTKWTRKNLKKGTYYKYYIVAINDDNGKAIKIQKSLSVHSTTSGSSYTNPTKVSVQKKKQNISVGKKGKSYAKVSDSRVRRHVDNLRYLSSDTSIATVSASGRIKAKKKGTCKIYVIAQDGQYKTITVKVK